MSTQSLLKVTTSATIGDQKRYKVSIRSSRLPIDLRNPDRTRVYGTESENAEPMEDAWVVIPYRNHRIWFKAGDTELDIRNYRGEFLKMITSISTEDDFISLLVFAKQIIDDLCSANQES